MKTITLGKTGITTPQNAFGALPIQRIGRDEAVRLLRQARDGGMTFFDTARAYTDSEEKLGIAFEGCRKDLTIASKTMGRTPEEFWKQLHESLRMLRTDYVDIYQLHCVDRCYAPGDGTGLYEALEQARRQGKVRHIGITTHKVAVAEEIVASGLYETLQFPFSYLASQRDVKLCQDCTRAGMGFIAMKGLSGGLLTNARACMAFMSQYEALPIWGIQREEELRQWLSFFDAGSEMTPELENVIREDRAALQGEFCRGCGYCAPCTAGIIINQCARMSQMIRRSPSAKWTAPEWQQEMFKIDGCVECGACKTRCPYQLDIPRLLRKNLADYRQILSGEVQI